MIEVHGLNKYYKSFHALKGIDLHVRRGEIYGFIGHNGAGKSTTINILTGLSRPASGECRVNGRNIADIRHPGELGIGYLPEEPRFYPWMTAYETLEYLSKGSGEASVMPQIMELLTWVGLKDAASRRVGGFSRGMRQRLGIAAAMIHDPDLLFLDEPSSALDPEGRSDVLHLIRELKGRGKTVFFSTHILDDVEKICDRVGMLAKGKLVLEKPLEALLKQNLSPVFDIELGHHDDMLASSVATLEGISGAVMDGTRLTVTVKDAEQDSRKLLAFLAAQSNPVLSFNLRKKSLEDIFIKEMKQQ